MRIKDLESYSYFKSSNNDFDLYLGSCSDIIPTMNTRFDMVFADPPYFLSNGGLTIQSGELVSVNKGDWDKLSSIADMDIFNKSWISKVRDKMKESATIWISGTMHNIFSIGNALKELDFKILNVITWEKSNPPPNFSCRTFTHSTEFIIWARKSVETGHYYNYNLMKEINANKQMKDVWTLPAIAPWEKINGKHPTQKPLSLLTRLVLASTRPADLILDPFTGSSTTGIAANLLGRRFVGIDSESQYLKISMSRKSEIEQHGKRKDFINKLKGFQDNSQLYELLNRNTI